MSVDAGFSGAASSSSSGAKPPIENDASPAWREQITSDARCAAASSLEPDFGELSTCTQKGPNRGIDVITGPGGDVKGFSITPVAQMYVVIDNLLANPTIITLSIAERYALAGKVAAVPAEHARLVERLASNMATSMTEAGALNAFYLLEICSELVPNFKEAIPEGRLAKAAELSAHSRLQAVVQQGQKPTEWELAEKRQSPSVVVLTSNEKKQGLVYEAGQVVSDITKFVSGTALGSVGLVTDKLGVTSHAEMVLTDTVEEVVDGTAKDFREKGVVVAVKDGMADAANMMGDFVECAVDGIVDGVKGTLDWVASNTGDNNAKHKVAIVVAELFGDERSIGLRLENRVITKFTKPEAEQLGWRLGDCIVAVGRGVVTSQEDMLMAISLSKEALKTNGTPIHFIVERSGEKPPGPKNGSLIFIDGRPARIKDMDDSATGMMLVQFEDDDTVVSVPAKR